MNEKEVSEIRRRFKPDKSNISAIRGCYVNEKGEIISEFSQSLSFMPEAEAEKFLSLLKRTLSGGLDRNLLNIEFTTQQVHLGEEHKLLMTLRDSALKDDEAVHAFFEKVIASVTLEENYVILLAHDVYDVPYRSRNDEGMDDASTEVYSYILCSICPVKMTKPALSYHIQENEFHSREIDRIVSPPELGFLFPAFDDRGANIYGTLYYTKDVAENHEEFVNAVFQCEVPMPAAEQKETFQTLLSDTLADDCSFDAVQGVHEQLQQMIETHKENKEEAPLTVSKGAMRRILADNGASEEHMAAFDEQFDAGFGEETELIPRNVVDTKQIEITLPDATIRVKAGRGDLIETGVINGAKYVMIRADEGAALNGVPIQIT